MNNMIDPEIAFSTIKILIADAKIEIARGGDMDLEPIYESTDLLCDYLISADPNEARPFAARLQKMIAELDSLSDGILGQLKKISKSPVMATAER